MTNGQKLLLTYPNLYVCVLYLDFKYIHIRDRNISYKMNDEKTCFKIPMDWWYAEYEAELGEDGRKMSERERIREAYAVMRNLLDNAPAESELDDDDINEVYAEAANFVNAVENIGYGE